MKRIDPIVMEIRNERRLQKMTLKELSGKSGVSIAALSYIENGHRSPTLETLRPILKVLNIRLELR